MALLDVFQIQKRARIHNSAYNQSLRTAQAMPSLPEDDVLDLTKDSQVHRVLIVCGTHVASCGNVVAGRSKIWLNGKSFGVMEFLKFCRTEGANNFRPSYKDILVPVKCTKDDEEGCVWLRWMMVKRIVRSAVKPPLTFDSLVNFSGDTRASGSSHVAASSDDDIDDDILEVEERQGSGSAFESLLNFPKDPIKGPCTVCLDDDEENLSCVCRVCKNFVHVDCMKQYIEKFYESENRKPFPHCLGVCGGRLFEADIAACFRGNDAALSTFMDQMIKQAVRESSAAEQVPADEKEVLMTCYSEDCNAALCTVSRKTFNNIRHEDAYVTCLTCENKTCMGCFAKHEADGGCCARLRQREDAESAKEIDATCKICPGCTSPVYQIDGCNKMICNCKTIFCFVCGATLDKNHPYAHFDGIGQCELWTNRTIV